MSSAEHPNWSVAMRRGSAAMEQPRLVAPAVLRDGWRTEAIIRWAPSFEMNTSWDIAFDAERTRVSIIEVQWDRSGDARRFSDPVYGVAHELKLRAVATLMVRTACVEAEAFVPQVRTVDFARIGLAPEGSCVDGNHWYVEVVQPDGTTLKFHWINGLVPGHYGKLVSWTQDVLGSVKQALVGVESQVVYSE